MPDTTSAEIANLAASEKVSLTHARVIARDFEAWVQTQPQAPVGGKVKRGIGLGTLLKIGSMVLVMIPRLMALAAGAVLVEMMADARRQMRDCSTWMHETVEITYTDAAGGPVPRPSAIGWECPKCGRVYSPNTSACAACNEEPPECMR
jgi:hypothetical protein